MLARKALAGTAGAPKVYVEDVFSTYLWTGNATARDIINGIDLAGEGGLVWTKRRNDTNVHQLTDTARGVSYQLNSASTAAESNEFNRLTAFNADGFSISTGTDVNANTGTYTSWTFRKAKKFFDVVTYTGNGSNRTISHNLGSVPGVIIVKRTDSTGNWIVYHRSLGATKYMVLEVTDSVYTFSTYWNDTEPTSTVFTVGTSPTVNTNGATYVAYLFAHDAGGFGDAGSDSIIKCGSFTTSSGGGDATVTLDWEPQWLLVKSSSGTSGWDLIDNMRGMPNLGTSGSAVGLEANNSNAEGSRNPNCYPTATGFYYARAASTTYIYIAIRRGPMKTPTVGTSVFAPVTRTGTGADVTVTGAGFPPDFLFNIDRLGTGPNARYNYDRLRGAGQTDLRTNSTAAEGSAGAIGVSSFNMNGFSIPSTGVSFLNVSSASYINYFFGRAPGFFDVVCYTGTGSATTVSHNLGVAPELMIVKRRSTAEEWAVYYGDPTKYLALNSTAAPGTALRFWNDTAPTSSVFTVGDGTWVNTSSATYVAYLFASVAGVSKVGSYTGNGSSVTVTTGFQPRFIMVKRTDSTGNWIVSDSARGLVSGSDPYLLLNSTAAEDTDEDWVDVSSTGFTVNETSAANANVNTGTYIYLAIA